MNAMANNRMYLREKVTCKTVMLAKRMGDEWYTPHETTEWLNDFLDKSFEARSNAKPFDYMFGPTTYDIVYEIIEEGSGAEEIK
jgi:hypothetical protein